MSVALSMDDLPTELTQPELEWFLAPAEPVRVLVVTDGSGRSLGFGLAVFDTEAHADEGARLLTDAKLEGWKIRVWKDVGTA